MGLTKRVYRVTDHMDCVKFLATFNYFVKQYENINFNPYLEYRLLEHLPESKMIHYTIDTYLCLLEILNNNLHEQYQTYFDCKENNYITETFLYVTKPPHEYCPESFLSLVYRIKDKDRNQIFNLRLSPYLSKETNEFELSYGFTVYQPNKPFAVSKLPSPICSLKEYFEYSTFSPCYIKNYSLVNCFYPTGLDSNRKNYKKDLDNLKNWAKNYPKYEFEFDDNGILISRNKKFKLSEISEEIPKVSSYVIKNSLV